MLSLVPSGIFRVTAMLSRSINGKNVPLIIPPRNAAKVSARKIEAITKVNTLFFKGRLIGKSDSALIDALFTAGAIGFIITKNATVSGAEGGCQAETGTASAMAAAGLVELMGGSPEQALTAAAITIKNIMGLVCDPIAGLVECPCTKRNAIGVANALMSADIALAGITSNIPFDEVVEAMYRVGKQMSSDLRETAQGGLAITPTGRKLAQLALER